VLALASVGLFYLPAAAALMIAGVDWRHLPAQPPAADDPLASNDGSSYLLLKNGW
jgi:hypothetical protein